jgi:hypothetical protein
MPAASAAVDYTGQGLPAEDNQLAAYSRTFRPSELFGRAANPGTDAPLSAQLAEHMEPGEPDDRRGRQTLQATSRDLEAQDEARHNSLLPAAFAATNAPDRTRGGLNGYDTPRPAFTRRNMFTRAFDQVIAQSLGIKVMQPAPIANVGLVQPDDASGALPVANSARGDRKAGIGSQPNTFRILPRPWDENLTTGDAGSGAFSASAQQQRSGWRAR